MKEASVLGAKTARACDSCLRRRARWFCGADDAFLCHSCDNLVHSANQLASRHDRVRLQTASNKAAVTTAARAWHSGFTRKARTPRHNQKHAALQQKLKDQVLFNNNGVNLPVVPELESHLDDHDNEIDEQLLCRVPVFDVDPYDAAAAACDLESFSEFLSTDMDLAEFAADVESLLGNGIDDDSVEMKGLEAVFNDCKGEEGERDASAALMVAVKVKDEDQELGIDDDTACHLESVLDMTCDDDAFDWNIDSVLSPAREEEEKAAVLAEEACNNNSSGSAGEVGRKKDLLLRLNYEAVITAWDSQGCPWTTGNPPKLNSDDDSWPNCLDWISGADVQCSSSYNYGEVKGLRVGGDGGREARVSRYREKRRTRLFAKKIRYEVRKLNAEKRPRMKGRFVKRAACFVGGATTAAAAFPAHH